MSILFQILEYGRCVERDKTYARQSDLERIEKWQSRLTGIAIVLGFIGIANLVKIWTG